MTGDGRIEPVPVRATLLIHQEGILAVVAIVGIALSERGLATAFSPTSTMVASVGIGVATGAACLGIVWLLRRTSPLRRLERWQSTLVAGWSETDAVMVALVSGLAEEALLRAFLQPIIGLLPAAVLFAALHLVPDRRLWFWPAFALLTGVVLGGLFELYGYPSAAAAHITINLLALLRLRRHAGEIELE